MERRKRSGMREKRRMGVGCKGFHGGDCIFAMRIQIHEMLHCFMDPSIQFMAKVARVGV